MTLAICDHFAHMLDIVFIISSETHIDQPSINESHTSKGDILVWIALWIFLQNLDDLTTTTQDLSERVACRS